MKKLLLILVCLPLIGFGQDWSNYYLDANITGNINHNINANINKNVKVTKTIKSIDYGALAIANAEKEKNRLQRLKYTDEKERNIILSIAEDPINAFNYGNKGGFTINSFNMRNNKEVMKKIGLKSFKYDRTEPHSSLFTDIGSGLFQNLSEDGITTEIQFRFPIYNIENKKIVNYADYKKLTEDSTEQNAVVSKPKMKDYKNSSDYFKALRSYNKKPKFLIPILNAEETAKMYDIIVGKLNDSKDDGQIFVHKKDINRATVCGIKGYMGTLIWEDEYQYEITDKYYADDLTIGNGITYKVTVRTYGDKDEVTFEQLEGRRYYLKRLMSKLVSSQIFSRHKF